MLPPPAKHSNHARKQEPSMLICLSENPKIGAQLLLFEKNSQIKFECKILPLATYLVCVYCVGGAAYPVCSLHFCSIAIPSSAFMCLVLGTSIPASPFVLFIWARLIDDMLSSFISHNFDLDLM